ncbi:MAG: hypothetical protein HKM06_00750 [Spirochaetales bacterium]|nr:hypothetical protein [Spirochaetales bacterium]
MKNQIHYDEDLFYLSLTIKNLQESLLLSLDPEYFASKVESDLKFIDESLEHFFITLKSSIYLIQRAEYFHTLGKVEAAFLDLFAEILSGKYVFFDVLKSSFETWENRKKTHASYLEEIHTILSTLVQEQKTDSDEITTPQELDLLMRGDVMKN